MEIKEVIERKEKLQHDISKLLGEFTKETLTNIENIDIEGYRELMNNIYIAYRTSIKIFI